MEIPQLKNLYQQYSGNKDFNMSSISLDTNLEFWKKAVIKEDMPWSQLIITPKARTYSKELLSYDGRIPTTLFYDGQGKLIKKFVGYNTNTEKEFRNLISLALSN